MDQFLWHQVETTNHVIQVKVTFYMTLTMTNLLSVIIARPWKKQPSIRQTGMVCHNCTYWDHANKISSGQQGTSQIQDLSSFIFILGGQIVAKYRCLTDQRKVSFPGTGYDTTSMVHELHAQCIVHVLVNGSGRREAYNTAKIQCSLQLFLPCFSVPLLLLNLRKIYVPLHSFSILGWYIKNGRYTYS